MGQIDAPASSTLLYGGVDVPPEVWGLDASTTGELSDAQIDELAAFDLGTIKVPGYPTKGRPIVLWFYAPLAGNAVGRGDAHASVMRAWCDRGGLAGLVQHCHAGMYTGSEANGEDDGACAAAFATSLGYPPDCYVALDDEAMANPGPDAYARVAAWCKLVAQANKAAIYEGFAPGLTPEQEYEIPTADRYWSAMGAWNIATRGPCCKQGPTIRIGGVPYDLDRFYPDSLGGVLRLMGRTDMWPAGAARIPVPDTAHADTVPPPAGA